MRLFDCYCSGFCVFLQMIFCHCHLSNKNHLAPNEPKKLDASPSPPISDHRFFLQEIFSKYGHNGQMTFEGFEHLLESLGLGNIIINDHDVQSHKDNEFRNIHGTHNHSKKADLAIDSAAGKDATAASSRSLQGDKPTPETLITSPKVPASPRHHSHENDGPESEATDHDEESSHSQPPREVSSTAQVDVTATHLSDSIYHYNIREVKIPEILVNISTKQNREDDRPSTNVVIEQCLSPRDILEAFGINQSSNLNPVSFLHLCPAIIYELDQGHCLFQERRTGKARSISTFDQWIYSSVAVLAISLCGLLSVAVIPIMQKWFYQTLLQFFVGLAVGSLCGDALLHLMPHAMLGEGNDHENLMAPLDSEKIAIWRGLAALAGIFLFFTAERLLEAVHKSRSKKDRTDSKDRDVESSDIKVCAEKKDSPYKKNSYDSGKNGKEMIKMLNADNFSSSVGQTEDRVHEHFDHLTGHGHSHGHQVPESVSAVAWMVIMGDGLHNFCDGIAIGAAFASGIEGGISTSIAVFCHELPHELGDFAMLLKTGMKVRQALFYNMLSSLLCLFGMAIGISLGSVQSATSWVFAGTAGMFLYIALVDMLPALTSSDENTATHHLAIQVLGISFGVSIMLLIANYEQELQNIIS